MTTQPDSPLAGEAIEHADSLMSQAENELMAQAGEPGPDLDNEDHPTAETLDVIEPAGVDQPSSATFAPTLGDASAFDEALLPSAERHAADALPIDQLPPLPPAPMASPLMAIPADAPPMQSGSGFAIGLPRFANLAKAAKQWVAPSQLRLSQRSLDHYHTALKELDESHRGVLEMATAIEKGPLGNARDGFRQRGVDPDPRVLSDLLDHPVVERQIDRYQRSVESMEESARNVMKAGIKAGIEPETMQTMLREIFDDLHADLNRKLDSLWDKIGRPLAELVERIAQRIAAVLNAVLRPGTTQGQGMN